MSIMTLLLKGHPLLKSEKKKEILMLVTISFRMTIIHLEIKKLFQIIFYRKKIFYQNKFFFAKNKILEKKFFFSFI